MATAKVFAWSCSTVAAIVLGLILFFAVYKRANAQSPAQELPAGWIAAPAAFVESAETYNALVKDAANRLNKITASPAFKIIQKEQDQARGISDRLSTPCTQNNPGPICMPPGFQYDAKLKALAPLTAKEPQPAK